MALKETIALNISGPALDDLAQALHSGAGVACTPQLTKDGILTLWVAREQIVATLRYLKHEATPKFPLLQDLSAIDERTRGHRADQPTSAYTVFYHLVSPTNYAQVRIKVALPDTSSENDLNIPTVTGLWPAANWYEREAFDMFGIRFEGHPNLRRILTPPNWVGHPLRKDHPARATELEPFAMSDEFQNSQQEALRFVPEDWGMKRKEGNTDYMFLNMGPNHPSAHGVFRIALQLDGEVIVDAVPDIGYHHRGAEKMGERQSWHSYIPYTDRIDYLGGVLNNLPYVMAVEKLAAIEVPKRAEVIRIMMCELFRISSHLVFYGTFVQDVGQTSPVFYMFADRERLFAIVEAITGGRMHPAWFRIGGVAQDLPTGWEQMVREFVDYMPHRLASYEKACLKNGTLRRRTIGVGKYTTEQAIEWGVTGPGLRATGLAADLRKTRPYAGYDQFDFEVPTGKNGDAYDRCLVRVAEIRESLKIVRQCLDNMPAGAYKADHPLTTPPPKERTMQHIETLIQHFVNVSWGPVIPAGEAAVTVEASKGWMSYYLVSDGSTMSYRTRIRTPSYPHLQMIPVITRGVVVADAVATVASIDYVMADVDR